jgi:hypothetical protein
MLLPDDVDIKTALDMLGIFKGRLSGWIANDSVVTLEGRILIKGDAIHELIVEIIHCEKQLKLDKVRTDKISKELHELENHNEPDWHDEDEQRCQNMRQNNDRV